MRSLTPIELLDVLVHYTRAVHCYCFYTGLQCSDAGELYQVVGAGFQAASALAHAVNDASGAELKLPKGKSACRGVLLGFAIPLLPPDLFGL